VLKTLALAAVGSAGARGLVLRVRAGDFGGGLSRREAAYYSRVEGA